MRFIFKTSYRAGSGPVRDRAQRNWYVALFIALLALPRLLPEYLGDISLVFIYALCGCPDGARRLYRASSAWGTPLLGIGAYAHVYFTQDLGMPGSPAVALAATVTAAAGMLVACPRCG